MRKTENKKSSPKLVRKECLFCKCQGYDKSNCAVKDKESKLIKQGAEVPKLETRQICEWSKTDLEAQESQILYLKPGQIGDDWCTSAGN